MHLSTLIIIDADRTLAVKAVSPETLNRSRILSMSDQEPEAKDRLSQDVENGIGDDLSVNRPFASSVSNTPDNWVESPENESEAANGGEESGCRGVLSHDCATARDDELVDDDKVRDACDGVVSPFLTVTVTERGEKSEENHDHVCDDGDEDIGSA